MGAHQGKSIKNKLKDTPEVLPFNELNNVDINFEKLLDIAQSNSEIEKKMYYDNPRLNTEKEVVAIKECNFYINFKF